MPPGGASFSRLRLGGQVPRRISSFRALCEDGSLATGASESAAVLADHWAAIFDAGDDIDDHAADRLLRHSADSELVSALRPLGFDECASCVAHARNWSPGLDGSHYSAWTAAGIPRLRTLHRAYMDLLSGVAPPSEFNRRLVVYIPKDLDHSPLRVFLLSLRGGGGPSLFRTLLTR